MYHNKKIPAKHLYGKYQNTRRIRFAFTKLIYENSLDKKERIWIA